MSGRLILASGSAIRRQILDGAGLDYEVITRPVDEAAMMPDKTGKETLFDKPNSMKEARARLLSMRGKKHELIGAVVICENGAPVWRHMSKTKLWVRDFSQAFLDWYIETEGQALMKSVGAYRFEGPGSQLFEKVEGDFFAILGLDLLPVLEYLRTRGVITS